MGRLFLPELKELHLDLDLDLDLRVALFLWELSRISSRLAMVVSTPKMTESAAVSLTGVRSRPGVNLVSMCMVLELFYISGASEW